MAYKFRNLIDIGRLPADPLLPDRVGPLYMHFVRQVPGILVVMFVLYGVVAVFNALLPWFVGEMVDIMAGTYADPAAAWADLQPYLWWFIGLGLIIAPIIGLGGDYFSIVVFVSRFGNFVRRQAHYHVIRQSLSYFQNDFAGRIANKVNQLGPAMRDALRNAIGAVFYVIVFTVSTMALMVGADPYLFWPMLVWILLYIVILWYWVPRIRARSTDLADAQSYLMGRIVDSYTNIMTVKLFARRNYEDNAVLDALEHHSDRFWDKGMQVFHLNIALNVINSLMIAVITVMSAYLWRGGTVTPGEIAMILPLVIQVKNQMHWIKWEVTAIFEYLGTTEDSMNTISRPHHVTDREGAAPLSMSRGDILFDNITFHYGKGGGIIDNLTLHVPPGQKVGLVGHSGAGKSTLVNLLLRFYDLEGGRILIDGQDIALHTQDSLRKNIAMVTQDTSLLHRSIIDNIRYGKPEATLEEVIEAAEKAHAHEFIKDLRDDRGRTGYEAHVGERGVKLSGGQRQRIAIARIILKNAPILILDEATSALDSEIESYIQEQLASLMEGKTVLAIAHRLSTINHLDRLVIMENGRIVEDGPHRELIKQDGHYARMWALQSGGFLPE